MERPRRLGAIVTDIEARQAVRRLIRVLAEIEFAMQAQPSGGSLVTSAGRGATRETTLQEAERVAAGGKPRVPDPARARYRRLMVRTLARIDRLASRTHSELINATPDPNIRVGSWRCGNCGKWRSDRETYCAACGTRHGDQP